jgi:hypothetical protein
VLTRLDRWLLRRLEREADRLRAEVIDLRWTLARCEERGLSEDALEIVHRAIRRVERRQARIDANLERRRADLERMRA